MKNSLRHYLKNLKRDKKRRRRSLALLLIVSMIVALSVSVGLRRTGVAMETTATTETEQQNVESAADTTAEATTVTEATDTTTETEATESDTTDAEDSTAVTPVSETDSSTEETADDTAVSEETTDATTEETTEGEEVVSSSSEDTTEDAADTFELSGQTTSGITVKVTGDAASLPYPADEITLEVKDQTMDDLSEEAKALYDKVLAVQNSNADKIVEEQTAEDGTVDEKDITEEAAQIASTTDGEIVKASDLEDGSVDDAETTTAGETADETADTTEATDETATEETVASSSETTTEDASEVTTETTITNRLIDVTLKHGDEEVEPTGEVQVEITSDALKDTESTLTVIHLDETNNQAVDTEAQIDTMNGIAMVSTQSFSVYLLSSDGTKVGEYDTLEDAFDHASDGQTIQLQSDYDITSPITITGKAVTLDLNGYHINVTFNGNKGGFIVASSGKLTIEDTNTSNDGKTAPTDTQETVTSDTNNVVESYDKSNDTLDITSEHDATVSWTTASWNDKNKIPTLTYYKTTSSPSDTGTTEAMEKHTYTTSGYICGNTNWGASGVVYVESGGELDIEGGLITSTNTSAYGHLIYNSGTVTMNGGYIAGKVNTRTDGATDNTDAGPGVYCDGTSTFTMNGGVIAANDSKLSGGGVRMTGNSTFTLNGGTISGNTVTQKGYGGGIYADGDSVLNIENGYITDNKYTGSVSTANSYNGGGGVAALGNATINMSGGYVTGNFSQEAGGGIYAGYYGNTVDFTMSGGTIAANYAYQGEGAGVRVAGGTTATVDAGDEKCYITNNKITHGQDWGGGGIFVQESGNLSIVNVLVTSNTADGYGGGMAGCPTGNTLLNMRYAAIYENTAQGTHFSSGTGTKNDDYASRKLVLEGKNNYAQDFYCVAYESSGHNKNDLTIANITGDMLGGGSSNWSGVITSGNADVTFYPEHLSGTTVPTGLSYTDEGSYIIAGETVSATHLAALTSNVSSTTNDITNAIAASNVIISGNYSNTNGGGIMSNGNVSTSSDMSNTTYPQLTLSGKKSFTWSDTDKTPINMTEGEFTFYLLKSEPTYSKGTWEYSDGNSVSENDTVGYLATAEVDDKGGFTFSDIDLDWMTDAADLSTDTGDGSGTITLYLIEAIGSESDVNYDTSVYCLSIPYEWSKTKLSMPGLNTYSSTYTLSDSGFSITKSDETYDASNYVYSVSSGDGTLTINSTTFANTISPVGVKVFKHISETSTALNGAQFQLYKTYDGSTYSDQVTTVGTADNSYTVTSGTDGYADLGNLAAGTYYLKETVAPDGYYLLDEPIVITITRTVDKDGIASNTVKYKSYGSSEAETTVNLTTDTKTNEKYYQIDVGNYSGTKLPNTGGAGTGWFLIGGCGIMSIAVLCAILSYRKKERRDLS